MGGYKMSIETFVQELGKLPRAKRIKKIKANLAFKKVFETDSVQGLAGLVSYGDQDLVFKLSIEINRIVEHEHFVLSKVNALRSYCPNFVMSMGLLPAYVNREFFEEQEHDSDTNIFDAEENPIPTNYLLIEYVNNVAFRHIIKYSSKATVTGVLVGVLCALQIAQNKLKFVHYDLHSDNILMKQVEEDSYFAYVIKGKVVVYPTFGWYPVIIDMGSSYIAEVDEQPFRASVCHCHHGLQSNYFDPLSDVHHFLLSALSSLEVESRQSESFQQHFRVINTRVMHIFRHFKIWREQGWKELPNNVMHMFAAQVTEAYGPTDKPSKFYRDMRTVVVETLALGVALPWKVMTDKEVEGLAKVHGVVHSGEVDSVNGLLKQGMVDLCYFLETLNEVSDSDIPVLVALRCLVETSFGAGNGVKLTKKTINAFKQATQPMFPDFNLELLDMHRCFKAVQILSKVCQHLFCTFNNDNLDLISQGLNETTIKSPIDMIPFLLQNTAVPYNFSESSVIYIWDSDQEKHTKTTFKALGLQDSASYTGNVKPLIQQRVLSHVK